MQTEFRRAGTNDLDASTQIIEEGRAYLKQQGVPQWQKGDPSRAALAADIENGEGYVLVADGKIVATLALLLREDESYTALHTWGAAGPYAALHRVAISAGCRGTGLSAVLMDEVTALCRRAGMASIRVDTHRQNLPMQHYLQKNGFLPRGVITLPSGAEAGAERLAFDKLL